MRERILQETEELTFRYGIKSVAMDDIARELGISKKTIYQHFEDKDAIILAVVRSHFEKERCIALEKQAEAKDPIQEVVWSSEMMRQQMAEMNPTVMFDMKKYHPKAWELFAEFKNNFVQSFIKENLLRGIEEGLYRNDINIEILAKMRLELVEIGFDPQVFPTAKFNMMDIQLVFLDHFIRGVVTEKGLELYQKYLTIKEPINS